VGAALDAYEEGGLDEAREVLDDGGRALLAFINGEVGLRFQDVAARLLPYVCGLAERRLELEPAARAATDTETVFLPERVKLFRDNDLNFLVYKYAASFQWGIIRAGTYRAELPAGDPRLVDVMNRYGREWKENKSWLESFFGLFPEPGLARRLFQAMETVRVRALLEGELPGLARDAAPALRELLLQRSSVVPDDSTRRGLFEALRRAALGDTEVSVPGSFSRQFLTAKENREGSASSLEAVCLLYEEAAALPEGGGEETPLVFEGELMPREAERARLRRRAEIRDLFMEELSLHLAGLLSEEGEPPGSEPDEAEGAAAPEEGVSVAARPEGTGGRESSEDPRFIRIKGSPLALPPELDHLVREIEDDLGGLPESYISGAVAMAGQSAMDRAAPEEEEGREVRESFRYDEWDFRRSGFRRNWCALHELEVEPADASFVPETLRRYRGQQARIRRSFEIMRTSERFMRRQREGEDIDIDAVTESLADVRAGLPPSERLFIRLQRDTRDIAALFLVDMSSSTEGWVNLAIKESLVLLCDALAILGDRYAVYGFSGMKRSRSEFYHIKHFDEPYSDTVRGRIAAIEPRDYTRMGPPIRHATEILKGTDAKVRMLVTLSDGKPEDYDDYRGDYSIEDTRHALIEAKTEGVHPFCITIDKEAREYISHMYGEVNYIVIDDVRKLPVRMPEIYRTLTT
jgi:nitric oxide reductase NorD protein